MPVNKNAMTRYIVINELLINAYKNNFHYDNLVNILCINRNALTLPSKWYVHFLTVNVCYNLLKLNRFCI